MRRGIWLTSLVVVAVYCFPALLCFGQNVAADPFADDAVDVVKPSEPVTTFRGQPLAERADMIDHSLRRNAEQLDFFDEPISDIVEVFSTKFGIPIMIHQSVLDETALSPDSPITIAVSNVPLHIALALIVEKYDCTIAIHNDVLQIVSKHAANELMEKRIYDCSRLIESASAKDQLATLEKLQDVLTRSIDANSWEINGGNAQVSEFAGKLVISQTLTNHLAIERVLNGLYDQLK